MTETMIDSLDPAAHPECPFCDENRIASEVTVRRSAALGVMCHIFEPLKPVTPGHMIVAPLEHVPNAVDSPRIAAGTMYVAAEYAAKVGECNIITSVGEWATQTVAHLHLHVVPRGPGDGLKLPWSR
jgi:histidine triad (HIT) family protein